MHFFIIFMGAIFIFPRPLIAQELDALNQELTSFDKAYQESEQEKQDNSILAADVRGLIWGLPKKDVQDFEASEFLGEFENALSFIGQDFNMPAYITYFFTNDQLSRAVIEYDKKNADPQDYINDYIDIRTKISAIYGQPSSEEMEWKSTKYKSDPERWGLAVMMGGLSFSTTWITDSSVMNFTMQGKGMSIETKLRYISKVIVQKQNEVSLVPDNF